MPTSSALAPNVRAFLAAPRWATIATLNDDGSPHQAVVWYLLEGDRILINSRRERRWPRNLERDGRISLAVHDHVQAEHWVGLRGQAGVLRIGEGALADIATMARRYGGDPDAYRDQNRITFAVKIERIFEYGS